MTQYLVLSTVVTRLEGESLDPVFDDVAAFHKALADKYHTAPPAPAPRWRVRVSAANIRAGPGVTHADIGDLRWGDVLDEISTRDGWVQTAHGWVSMTVLERVNT